MGLSGKIVRLIDFSCRHYDDLMIEPVWQAVWTVDHLVELQVVTVWSQVQDRMTDPVKDQLGRKLRQQDG